MLDRGIGMKELNIYQYTQNSINESFVDPGNYTIFVYSADTLPADLSTDFILTVHPRSKQCFAAKMSLTDESRLVSLDLTSAN